MQLKWVESYETLKFDTPDGDLHKDQYAVYKGKHYVRIYPENNAQFICVEGSENPDGSPMDLQSAISGKTQVNVIEGEKMYYDKFALPDGRFYRVPSTKKDYFDLSKKGAKPREKSVTENEIVEIKKDDHLWS